MYTLSHPIGSFLVKVRLRLGLAWLMGMVLPCRDIQIFNPHSLYLYLADIMTDTGFQVVFT